MADYRVLDIETVPDESCWTRPEPRYTWTSGEVLKPEEVFPPPQAHRVVSIASLDLTSDDDGHYYHCAGARVEGAWADTQEESDRVEERLLRLFGGLQNGDRATLVTWNGRTFDLPVISIRSLRYGIPVPWYYAENVRYRYSEAGHCDLMDFFSDYGASRSIKLGDMARSIGLPGKTGEVSGSTVGEVVRRGANPISFQLVNGYCLSDVVQTALLFVRSRFHKGMINKKEHNAAMDSFRNFVHPLLPDWYESSLARLSLT